MNLGGNPKFGNHRPRKCFYGSLTIPPLIFVSAVVAEVQKGLEDDGGNRKARTSLSRLERRRCYQRSNMELSFSNMGLLPRIDVGHLRASVDVFIPSNSLGLRQSPLTLADASSVFPRPSFGFKDKGITTRAVFASKKGGGRSHKSTDLDNEEDLVTEADLQYKPVGFGQGKVYDTSLEDKILEEIEQGKATKTASLEKQKTNERLTNSSKIKSTSKHLETVNGVKVWVGDLPKKKNIDRDLRSAFRHVPGLVDISPSVQGNEKTRDPICKGFGFLTFDTADYAESFISSFQDRPVSFGKVEKKVTFKLVKANNAEVVPSEKQRSTEVGTLRIRNKDAGIVIGSNSITQLTSLNQNVLADAMQEVGHTEKHQSQVEVIEDGEAVGLSRLHGASSSSEEEDSGDEYDSDSDPEFEITVGLGEFPRANAPRADTELDENTDTTNAENRIKELERQLRKKLEDAGHENQKSKHAENTVKAKSLTSKRIGASKKSLPKGNNVAAVTHGLKKKERAFMTGVLEKYGKVSSTTKP